MQRRADLHHARAAQDMFKRIATGINAACADDLDGRIQSLVERVDIGERSRFDVSRRIRLRYTCRCRWN